MKKQIKMYLHSSKEGNIQYITEELEIELSEEALHNFMYALYEVEFDVELDTDTGDVRILKVNGRELKEEL